MCLIIDASVFSEFVKPESPDMKPVKKWMEEHGKMVYSPTEKFKSEIKGYNKFYLQFESYRRSGKVKMIDKDDVLRQQNKLSNLRSNDPHIIALAKVANVNVLVSDDKDLNQDFKNQINKGKIYKHKKHKHLLARDMCP